MKIAWKVAVAALCILVVFFGAGSCLLISLSFRSALTREVDVAQEELQMLRVSYEAVCMARGVTAENMFREGRSVARVLEENRYFAGRQFRVTTETGRTVYSTMEPASDEELLEEIDESSRGYSIRREEKTGQVFIHCADTIDLDDGVLYLESARNISSLFADRETHYRIYRYLLLAVVAAAGGVLYLTSCWLTQPIRDLGKVADRLADGDYTSRAEVEGGDEVSELAESFNSMADAVEKNVHQLADAARRQEDFTASFVHELKTPLTSIIGYADMLRSGALDGEKSMKAAAYIFSEGKRLEKLSMALMDLLVTGHGAVSLREVDMARLCRQAAEAARPAMAAKGLELQVSAQEGTLRGNESLLETMLINLLDNARKASESGTVVTLEGCALPEGYRLTVTDQGRGIPAQELEKITEAFYMVDKSRSRAEGGAGLGLALCKTIAAFHGGSLSFASQEGHGTTVVATLGGAAGEQ